MGLEPGQGLLHYRLIDKLGQGGMGVVWKAVDTTLDREVAIKILPAEFSADPERLARFEREAKTVASLNHPNIAAVYSVHEHEGTRFLAMELVHGEDLAVVLGRGPLSLNDALLIARQVAEALEVAHEHGVVHRDLKPANVQLTPEGQAKVLDFGLAKAAEARSGESSGLTASPTVTSLGTMAGTILGTAAYMSPEQARGKGVDSRTDIWAFGCLLYEMLTGRQLFQGETVTDLLGAIMHREPDWGALPAGVPPSIRRLLRRCLERDPRQRLRDIGDARIVLGDALAGKADAEMQAGAASATRSRGANLAILAATALLAAAVGAVAAWFARPQADGLPLRKFDLSLSTGDSSGPALLDPVISPDGKHLVYTADNRLWVRDLDKVTATPLAGTDGATDPFWSPDAGWIGFARGRSIEKIARSGGEPTRIAVTGSQTQLAGGKATWGEDGRIVWTSSAVGLMQVSAQGGDPASLLDPAEGESDFHELCRLPGGGFVFVVHVSGGDFGKLGLLTPDGRRRDVYAFDSGNLSDPVYSPTGHLLFRRDGAVAGIWALPFSATSLEVTGEPFLVVAEGRTPSVADDGTLVYMNRGATRTSRLAWVDRDGGNPRPIGEPLETLYPFPALSADASQVLVTGSTGEGREVWLYDTATGLRRQITFTKLRQDMAVWFPGEREALSYSISPFVLHLTSLDGSEPDREIGEGIMGEVTADGSQLFFARIKPDAWDWDIYVRAWEAGHDTARPLIEGPGVQWWPKLSPDGRALAYTTDEGGQDEVFVATLPDARRRWQISRNGGSFPQWREDGREIYFAWQDAILAVEVSAAGMPVGEPRELFRRPVTGWAEQWTDGFDVSADGKRFVIAENIGTEGEEPSIVVVQNWAAEFAK